MEFSIDGNNIGHYDYTVMSSDTDSFYNTRLSLYQELVQEVAGLHANYRGVGISDLQKAGKTWVIARSRMEIYHYGWWQDVLDVETWPQDPVGLNCPRIVRAFNRKDGNPVFFTNTKWAIIDTVKGRPLRPKEVTDALILPPKELQMDATLPNNQEKFESCDKVLAVYEPVIHYLDTDVNHHVNNVSYTNWILEALPASFMDAYKPSLVDVRWIRQTYRKDHLTVTVLAEDENGFEKENPELYFRIERIKDDGSREDVFDALTEWKPRNSF